MREMEREDINLLKPTYLQEQMKGVEQNTDYEMTYLVYAGLRVWRNDKL